MMGIRFQCPSGHKLNVKVELAGKRASCPECGVKLVIPAASVEPAADPASRMGPPAAEPTPSSPVVEPVFPAAPQPVVEPIASVGPEPLVTEPVVTEPIVDPAAAIKTSNYAYERRRTQRKQLTLAVMMFVAVVVLAGILVFVIRSNLTATSGVMPQRTSAHT